MLTILLILVILWKPIYYLFMMVIHSLNPVTTGNGTADDYVGKIVGWFKDLVGLVSPTDL